MVSISSFLKKYRMPLLVLVFSAAISLIPFFEAAAGPVSWAVGGVAGGLLSFTTGILRFVNSLLVYLLMALQGILSWVLDFNFYTGIFRNAPAVRVGWRVVRDLVNMFFLIGLVVIGFATILRVESYGMRRLLFKFVIAALLVNFSLILPIVIIDMSNVFLHFFAKPIQDSGFVVNMLEASRIWAIRASSNNQFLTGASNLEVTGLSFGVELLLTMFLLFFSYAIIAIVGILIVRIVALWILIIMAPVAFLAGVFPFSARYFQTWLTQLFSWSFLAPIMAFFLYLGAQVASTLRTDPHFAHVSIAGPQDAPMDFFSQPAFLFSYLVVVVFLYGSVYVATKSSAAGASVVAERLSKWALGTAVVVSGVSRLKRRWQERRRARGAAREEASKERFRRRMRLREAGGIRQLLREKLSPTREGRASARARRRVAVEEEAKRMARTMKISEIARIQQSRGRAFTAVGRMQRASATLALANARVSERYARAMHAREQTGRLKRPLEGVHAEAEETKKGED